MTPAPIGKVSWFVKTDEAGNVHCRPRYARTFFGVVAAKTL